ncbi:MAG: hypothetical protein Kow0069_19870 [Promethearchaeota archaeon]
MAAKKRKRKYVPGIAQLNFKPTHDWEFEEAHRMYDEATHPLEVDVVHYGDCVAGMDGMPDECVDLVVADPPFGLQFDGKGSQYNRDSGLVVEGYHEADEDYGEFTSRWISRLPRIMKPTASAYVFSGWTNLLDVLAALRDAGLHLVNHLVWKYQFGVFTRRKFVTSHYHVLFVVKDEKKYFFNKVEHYPLDVWDVPRKYRPGEKKNGTKLPEAVVERCIHFSSKPGDLVFDPFVGNGTTAVCAKATFRHFLGFEVNAALKELVASRLATVKPGSRYGPYRTWTPSPEELAKKYPAVRKELERRRKAKK